MITLQSLRPTIPLPKWLLGPGVMVCVASLAAYAQSAQVLGLGGNDLAIYRMGGSAYLQGLPIYEQQYLGWPFTYPPVTVLLFGPMSLVPHTVLLAMVAAFNIAAVAVVIWLTFRMLGYQPGPGLVGAVLGLTGAAVWLHPVYATLRLGQINIALMLLVLADFALSRYRRWPTGVLIGIATAIKLVPGLFILYLLLTRRFRSAITAGVTFVALSVLGFIVAPSDSRQFWFSGILTDSDRIGGPNGIDSAYHQSLHGVLVRALGLGVGDIAWYPVALLVLVGGLAVAVAASRLGEEPAGVVACGLTALLISPVSWDHHWVWIVPVLVLLADLGRRIHRTHPITAGTLPFVVCLGFLVWPRRGYNEPGLILDHPMSDVYHAWTAGRHNLFVLVASAEYPLIGLALLIGAGWFIWRYRSRSAPRPPALERERALMAAD